VTHVKAECFIPNSEGKQIYQVDNSCEKIAQVLREAGYGTKVQATNREWGGVLAYKKILATDLLTEADFAGSME